MKITLALLLLCVISAPLAGGPILAVTAAGTTLYSTGPDEWPVGTSYQGLEVYGLGPVFTTSGAPGLTNTVFRCDTTCTVGFVFDVLGADASFGWLPGNPLVLHLSGLYFAPPPLTATYFVNVSSPTSIPVLNPVGLMTLDNNFFDVSSEPIIMGGTPPGIYNLRVTLDFGTQAEDFVLILDDSFEIQVVPEAQTWMLVGVGLFALLLRRRLRA